MKQSVLKITLKCGLNVDVVSTSTKNSSLLNQFSMLATNVFQMSFQRKEARWQHPLKKTQKNRIALCFHKHTAWWIILVQRAFNWIIYNFTICVNSKYNFTSQNTIFSINKLVMSEFFSASWKSKKEKQFLSCPVFWNNVYACRSKVHVSCFTD